MSRLVRTLGVGLLSAGLWLGGLRGDPVAQAAAPGAGAREEPEASVRRFALFVGANDGGVERERLLYAVSDVQAMAKALADLGGVAPADRIILEDPSAAGLEQGFSALAKKIEASRRAGERVQFVFYYSGHSDETGLLLGGVHVDYKSLRAAIDRVPADVRIGVLDSCSSGAFTRFKGGRKRAPFLIGSAAEVQGHAYLTSSSADEAAQESDRIGGSFFTHFLVTGLRGAADADGDRRVTLDEAYRFAFDETLARTETTAGGPQHAAYDIDLAGTGDLVMTDLRTTSARLEIAAAVHGRIYVRDRRGNLAAELFKAKGSPAVTLALEPGNYAVTVDDGSTLHRAEVAVRGGKAGVLEVGELEDIPVEGTRLRGGGTRSDAPKRELSETRLVPFNIGVSPRSELNAAYEGPITNTISLSAGVTDVTGIAGIQAALGMARARERVVGMQAAVGVAQADGTVSGAQLAVGLSRADEIRGLQSAAINVADTRMSGVQVGALDLAKKDFRGMQVGLVNVAGQGGGLQAGLVNVSRGALDGVQIGLINYADEADVSLALIPYTRKGGVWFDVFTSDTQLLNLALRFRARKSYTFFTVGGHPLGGDGSASWSAGMGFGGPLLWRKHFSIELDNTAGAVWSGMTATSTNIYFLDTLRLSFAFRPARHFAIWAAPTLNFLVGPAEADGVAPFRPGYDWSEPLLEGDSVGAAGVNARYWPGFAVGFQF